ISAMSLGSESESHRRGLGATWPLESAVGPACRKLTLLKRVRHPRQKAVGLPALGGRCLCFRILSTVVHVEKKGSDPRIELCQRQSWLPTDSAASRSIAVQLA